MTERTRSQRRTRLVLEELESRLVPTLPAVLTIPLDPTVDQFGDQIVTVQAYGDSSRATESIFDTGASAITFSADDQAAYALGPSGAIPIKVPGGAQADGIGGAVIGDVSQPGAILADGLHALNLTFDALGFPNETATFDQNSAQADGVQTFVGTYDGSPDLPTITGTPILNPSTQNPNGLAARIDMQGYTLDFSDLVPGLTLSMPDLHFVSPGTDVAATAATYDPVYIPLGSFGSDNHADPGNVITESTSPMVMDVAVTNGGTTVQHLHFLVDTGAQLSVISPSVAQNLGLDLTHPDDSIDVQGVGGTETVPGFTIDKLDLPRTDGGTVEFTTAPVYVLDVAPGIDGILGMNLWNNVATLEYDPFNPGPDGARLGITFNTAPEQTSGLDLTDLSFLQGLGGAFAGAVHGHGLPGFSPGASLSGNVFQDDAGNGLLATGARGEPGVTVFLDTNRDGKFEATEPHVLTDSLGNYSFTGLKAGKYKVMEVTPPGWVRTTVNRSYYVTLARDQQVSGLTFGNFQLVSVNGTVFADGNGNGALDPGEAGLKGVTVVLDRNINGRLVLGVKTTTTGSNGTYSFSNLRPGTYRVREVRPAGTVVSTAAGTRYTITTHSGQNVSGQDFGAFRLAKISGSVFNDVNNNGSRDMGEPGLSGWLVILDIVQNGQLVEKTAVTGRSGAYQFTGLGPGNYTIGEVSHTGWMPTDQSYTIATLSGKTSTANFGNYQLPTSAATQAPTALDQVFAMMAP